MVVAELRLVIVGVFGPLITDQYPVPCPAPGVLAAIVVVVPDPQMKISFPAAAVAGGVDTDNFTSS